MNLRAIAHQPAFMIGAGLVALLLVLALLRKGTGSRGTAAAAQPGVVANPSQGPTQASDVGATAALGAIQQHISSFEQDLSTWVAQNPHVPTPGSPTPTPASYGSYSTIAKDPSGSGQAGVPVFSGASWMSKLLGYIPYGSSFSATASPMAGPEVGGWGRSSSTLYEPLSFGGQTGYVSQVDVLARLP